MDNLFYLVPAASVLALFFAWFFYHQMNIQRNPDGLSKRFYHGWSKSQIRDKMSIHHIDVQDTGSCTNCVFRFRPMPAQLRR